MVYEIQTRRRSQFRVSNLLIAHGIIASIVVLVLIVAGRYLQDRLGLTAASRAQAASAACPKLIPPSFGGTSRLVQIWNFAEASAAQMSPTSSWFCITPPHSTIVSTPA